MRVLIFGGSGCLGRMLSASLLLLGHDVIPMSRRHFDLTDVAGVSGMVVLHNPDVVINAASITSDYQCYNDPYSAILVNFTAVGAMAKAATRNDALFINIATDSFQSNAPFGMTETVLLQPFGPRAWTVVQGEVAAQVCGRHFMGFRVSSLYGPGTEGMLFPLEQAAKGAGTPSNPIKVPRVLCAPTSVRCVAAAVAVAVAVPRKQWDEFRGIYNISTVGGVWYKTFVDHMLTQTFGKPPEGGEWAIVEDIQSITSPMSTYLLADKFTARFGVQLPTWQSDFETISKEIVFPLHKEPQPGDSSPSM